MQLLFLAILAAGAGAFTTWLTQSWLAESRGRRCNLILFFLLTFLNAAGTVLFEGLVKAGRPTFYYHTHPIGMVTLRLFGGGVFLTSLFAALLIWFWKTKVQRKTVRETARASLTRVISFALLGALVAELFLFNFRHFELVGFEDKPARTFERGSFHLYGFYFNRASQKLTSYKQEDGIPYGLAIYPGDVKARNIQLPVLIDQEETRVQVNYSDEAFEFPQPIEEHILSPDVPNSYFIPLHTIGKTYKIEIIFPDVKADTITEISLDWVKLNQVVPLKFLPYRFGLMFVLFLIGLAWFPRNRLYAIRLNFHSPAQNVMIGILLLGILGIFGWTVFSNYPDSLMLTEEEKSDYHVTYDQYNQLVSALEIPSYALEKLPDKSLLSAHRPYDISYRNRLNVQYEWDAVFYNGRYYVYFGIVPVVTLLLPWKQLTGAFMPLDFAAFLFASLGVLGLYGLYSRVVQRAFPRIPFLLYLAGFMMMICASGLSWCLRRVLPYELAILSGFCFAVWGVFLCWLAFENRERRLIFPLLLFGSGACTALAVGCRPTQLFVSLAVAAVPFCFFTARHEWFTRRNWICLAAFAIPYVLVGLALMNYNYQRFGSVFEFGIHYQLTIPNHSVSEPELGPGGWLLSLLHYLFASVTLDWQFPFIHMANIDIPYDGLLYQSGSIIGMFAFPLFSWLMLIPRFAGLIRKKRVLPLVISFLGSGALILGFAIPFSVSYRYTVDFIWLFGLVAVLVIFACWEYFAEKGMQRWMFAAVQVALMAGIFLFISVTLTGEGFWFKEVNPSLYRQLEAAFTPWL